MHYQYSAERSYFHGIQMPKPSHIRACAGLLVLFSSTGFSETVIVNLEEPNTDGVYTGISNLRGWAVAESGIAAVEIDVDGNYAFDVPMGGVRGDVARGRVARRLHLIVGPYPVAAGCPRRRSARKGKEHLSAEGWRK